MCHNVIKLINNIKRRKRENMPVIHINHRAELDVKQKRELSKKITQVFVEVLSKDPELVEIFWHDIEDHNFAKGGKLLMDRIEVKSS